MLTKARPKHHLGILILGWLFTVSPAFSQSPSAGEIGIPMRGIVPYGSYEISKIETIDQSTGNLLIHIPLAQMPPGRGGSSRGIDLVYNSAIYSADTAYNSDSGYFGTGMGFVNLWDPFDSGGWRYGYKYDVEADRITTGDCRNPDQIRYRLLTPDGSSHVLHILGRKDEFNGFYSDSSGLCRAGPKPSYNMYTSDGTFLNLSVTFDSNSDLVRSFVLQMPDGSKAAKGQDGVLHLIDKNGNSTDVTDLIIGGESATRLADAVGRTITIVHHLNGDQRSSDTITQAGYNDAPLTWTVNWGVVTLTSTPHVYASFCGFSTCEIGGTSMPAVTVIVLPNGLSYQFEYGVCAAADPAPCPVGWGQLSTMTMPTLARVTYTYRSPFAIQEPGQTNTIDVASFVNPMISSKTLTWTDENDQSVRSEASTFAFTNTSSTFTHPDGGSVTSSFVDRTLRSDAAKYDQRGIVYKTAQEPSGDVVERAWSKNIPYGTPNISSFTRYLSPGNPFVQAEIRSVGPVGSPALSKGTTYAYDRNGNQTSSAEYDWVAYDTINHLVSADPPAGGFNLSQNRLIRFSDYTYAKLAGPAATDATKDDSNAYWHFQAPSILSAICASTVGGYDATNNLVVAAHRQFLYDGNAASALDCSKGQTLTNGNITGELFWDSTLGGDSVNLAETNSVGTSHTYDTYGNLASTTNARGATAQYTSDSNGLYVTKVIEAYKSSDAVDRTFTLEHDGSTGVKTKDFDKDHSIERRYDYDKFSRLESVNENGVRHTTYRYDDTNKVVTESSDLRAFNDQLLVQKTYYDQLGRVRLTTDAAGNTIQTRYYTPSGAGFSYELASNPYVTQSESTMGWTRTKRDTQGRVVEVAHFTGSGLPSPWGKNAASSGASTMSYRPDAKNKVYCTTATDEAGVARTNCSDALGRLTSVTEAGISATTSYTYDALDNLRSVTQPGVNSRTFAYSSLKRLISATNPESGIIGYKYDGNGNLRTRTDAANVTTTYEYDSLDQTKKKSYDDGRTPTVTYSYDHSWLTQVATSASAYNYTSWDGIGRVTAGSQSTAGAVYPFTLAYRPTVGIDWMQYPGSQRRITTGYDSAGRPVTLAGQILDKPATNYVRAAKYQPHGAMKSRTLGNGLVETRSDNARLQPVSIGVGNLLQLGFDYGVAQNNGNVLGQTIKRGADVWTETYGYAEPGGGSVNRLTSAGETGTGTWSQNFCYDAAGNRWVQGYAGLVATYDTPQGPDCATSPFDGNNRIRNWGYDGKGNTTRSGTGWTFGYDAENRQLTASDGSGQASYVYDGEGRRVQKTVGSAMTTYVYDPLGQLAQEYSGAADAGTTYLHVDALGSTRLQTDELGGAVRCLDYLPFGEEMGSTIGGRIAGCFSSSSDSVSLKFTGKERDSESGLDYFGARYYGSRMGRFSSPDEVFADQSGQDPQSWNLYNYVRNNPLVNVDPDGMRCDFSKASNGADVITDSDGKGCAELRARATAYAYDEPGIAMLASVGNKLTDPHEWVDLTSRAARGVASVIAPQASAITECLVPGGDCDGTNLALAAVPAMGVTRFVKNKKLLNIMKALNRTGTGTGTGSTADAVRKEIATGIAVGGKFHYTKAIQARDGLLKLWRDRTLDPSDRAVVKELLKDVQEAVSRK